MLVFVLVSEDDFGKRCTSAGIVYNVPDNSLDIAKKKVRNNQLGAFATLGNCLRARFVCLVLTQLFQRSQEF